MSRALIEVARLDGASHFTTYRAIVLPLARPALATVAILACVARWNDFFWPFLILTDERKYTVQLSLAQFFQGERTQWALVMAVAVIISGSLALCGDVLSSALAAIGSGGRMSEDEQVCPTGDSAKAWKHGYDRRGRQLFRCRPCRGRFTALTATPCSGYRFPPDIIALAVRWYVRYRLRYADVAELLAERGVRVDPSTIYA